MDVRICFSQSPILKFPENATLLFMTIALHQPVPFSYVSVITKRKTMTSSFTSLSLMRKIYVSNKLFFLFTWCSKQSCLYLLQLIHSSNSQQNDLKLVFFRPSGSINQSTASTCTSDARTAQPTSVFVSFVNKYNSVRLTTMCNFIRFAIKANNELLTVASSWLNEQKEQFKSITVREPGKATSLKLCQDRHGGQETYIDDRPDGIYYDFFRMI